MPHSVSIQAEPCSTTALAARTASWPGPRGVLLLPLVSACLAWGCQFDPPGLDPMTGDPGPGDTFQAACVTNASYAVPAGATHGYRVVDTPMSYDQAHATCAGDGAHLVAIADGAENSLVSSLAPAGNKWIGYDDLDIEGMFRWVDGSASAFTIFQSGEPSNATGEDCVALLDDQAWHDRSCNEANPFVCECDTGYFAPKVPACITDSAYSRVLLGRRYRYVTSTKAWQSAADDCAATGAHLAVISDFDENTVIDNGIVTFSSLWIGLSDEKAEGQFQWIDGSTNPFTRWASGEPNNAGDAEDCGEFKSDGEWNDTECMSARGYVCECDPKVSLAR